MICEPSSPSYFLTCFCTARSVTPCSAAKSLKLLCPNGYTSNSVTIRERFAMVRYFPFPAPFKAGPLFLPLSLSRSYFLS